MEEQKKKLTNETVIKSVYTCQKELLKNLMKLYAPNGFELDPTYSKGNFYKGLPEPDYKFDIRPQLDYVWPASCTDLPLFDNSIESILFDPPFLATTGNVSKSDRKSNIIIKRFGYYKNMKDLWQMYYEALREFKRILKYRGVLVVKMQDSISSGKQFFSHNEVHNIAYQLGYYPKDIFILVSKNVILSPKHVNQKHARKFHSYFMVFTNEKSKVDYSFIEKGDSI